MKVDEQKAKNEKLVGGLLFDEVSIRKHLQWVTDRLVGFEQFTEKPPLEAVIASDAIVFMFSAINDDFRLPIAYFFIASQPNAASKMEMLTEVLKSVLSCGVEIMCITFDAMRTNPTMCEMLGANLNVYSDSFNPSILVENKRIFVIFDFSHVEKLIHKKIWDSQNNQICWRLCNNLLQFKKKEKFSLYTQVNTGSH